MKKSISFKMVQRFLAVLCAVGIALASLPALAENSVNEEPEQLTFEKYLYYTENYFQPLIRPFLKFPHGVYTQIYPAFFYSNYEYCWDIKDEIEDLGLIFFYDLSECRHFIEINYVLPIADVNIARIKKKADINNLFDSSKLILNPEVSELAHNALENYVAAYKKGTVDCDEYRELMEQLSVLKKRDFINGYCILYNMLEELHKHCIIAGFSQKEIRAYLAVNGKEIAGVNTEIYQDTKELYESLVNKEDRTPLEEDIVLYLTYPYGTVDKTELRQYGYQIHSAYDTYIKTHPDHQ